MNEQSKKRAKSEHDELSLHPLSVEDALRGAMATGKPPEMPKRARAAAKRAPTKRRKNAKDRD